ncbi:hypothetical protein PoB_004607600 [Plakobranchus ocellatus]|uniref:Uncharacterized protein n=1 Tax=Plakobranchus ocellatus TaxID=259542 RepID=A0AAV4B849_9GAST|nr:hypothetical protein PoB_004607600 [Plakobranchus ocellatus]
MHKRNTCFIRHDKSPSAAPAQGNGDSYNLVNSDNDNSIQSDTLTRISSLRASKAAFPPAMTCCNLTVQLAHQKLTHKHVGIHLQHKIPIIK